MADQVTHYSDQTTYVKNAIEYLRHLAAYSCLVTADFSGITTWAGLRANIVLHVPPAVHVDTINVIREACGDGASLPGVLGRLSLILGSTFDTLIATAAADTNNEVSNLCSALTAYTAPDTVASTADYTFAHQV